MKCSCCDGPLANPQYNPYLRGNFELCGTCLEVIKTASDEFEDVEEDNELEYIFEDDFKDY